MGIVGGGLGTLIGMLVGFTAGYRGGMVDEILTMFTNVVLVIPTLAVLLIIVAYLEVRGIFIESYLYWMYGLAVGGSGHPLLLLDSPNGCRFRERCLVAFDKCLEKPPFMEIEQDHFVACWKEFEENA